ncbi:MAG TPA: serine hydrolase [Caulobacteraceae bacterium]|nr:serine hydrolase [Caulobacteraceae bacterium]
MSGIGFQATRRAALAAGLAGAGLAAFGARAQTGGAAAALDALAREVMAANPEQPAIALAVIENGEITLTKGYGVKKLGEPAPADERTLFGIASNTKAMTAAALAMLVEEKKIEWDAPVTRYLPGFAMSDETVGRLMTVRDLLVHRSGLSLGAGDLMLWPEPKNRARAELVAGMKHLPISGGFRSGYAYDNVLYVVAGEVVAAVSGMSWEEFVRTRIFAPLGMSDTLPSPEGLDPRRAAYPHARLGPPIRGVGAQKPLALDPQFGLAAAAGGVWTHAVDIAKWVRCQLLMGQGPNGRLWSEASAREMWKPQTITASTDGPTPGNPSRATIEAYALGWFVRDYRGERLLTHTGGLAGYISVTALLPGRKSGLMVMTNAEEGSVLRAMRYGGLDRIQGRSDFDWTADSLRVQAKAREDAVETFKKTGSPVGGGKKPTLPLEAYAGVYRDPWYGTITVTKKGKALAVSFDKSNGLAGSLEPFDGDTFRTRFANPDMEDALFTFEVKDGAVTGATAKPLSPLADFSFDYQDLRLTRE